MYRTHIKSDLDVLHMHGKRTRCPFEWNPSQVKIKSDSTIISEKMSISRVQLIQELFILKLMPMSHTTYNWGVLRILRKVRR
jgi:hypothetical protein